MLRVLFWRVQPSKFEIIKASNRSAGDSQLVLVPPRAIASRFSRSHSEIASSALSSLCVQSRCMIPNWKAATSLKAAFKLGDYKHKYHARNGCLRMEVDDLDVLLENFTLHCSDEAYRILCHNIQVLSQNEDPSEEYMSHLRELNAQYVRSITLPQHARQLLEVNLPPSLERAIYWLCYDWFRLQTRRP